MSYYMNEAIKEAYKGIQQQAGGPFGCVIVKDGRIVGRGHNQVLKDHDPTCHGEMVAIRDACKNLGTHDLSGCELYTTAYPCPMCKGAIQWANIQEVFYGCDLKDTDSIGFRDLIFQSDTSVYTQVDQEHCQKLFIDYKNAEHELY